MRDLGGDQIRRQVCGLKGQGGSMDARERRCGP